MRVRDLGPLLIEQRGQDQPVVGTKGSAMLALLTIHVNQQVSVDALTAAAWGERVSAGAASTLLSHIWRLRQLLEPDRLSGDAPTVLLNDDGGYRLVGTADTVDSLFLAQASSRVRDDLAAGRLDAARAGADEALARWRGRPYGRAADADWARPAVARLDELHEQVQERRIAALLGLGALDTALSDLRPLIAADPHDRIHRCRVHVESGIRGPQALHHQLDGGMIGGVIGVGLREAQRPQSPADFADEAEPFPAGGQQVRAGARFRPA